MPPNIIWITNDQHRYDSLGCNGNDVLETPHLDALAAQGVRFTNCFSQSPVCAAQRACFLTGRYPHLHGQLSNGFTMAPGEVWWPEILSAAGYLTAGIGKMHLEPWDDPRGFEHRFIVEGKDFLLGEDEYARFCKATYGFIRPRAKYAERGLSMVDPMPSEVPYEDYIDKFIADSALRFLDETRDDPRPLALHVSLLSPHHPLDPPTEYFDRYANKPVPPHRFDPAEKQAKPPEQTQHMWFWDRAGEAHRQRAWRSYYGLVTLVDDQVGRIIEKLGDVGRLDDAFIVFTTDHGEMLFDHGLFDKAFACYDPIIHVPAIVRWPGKLPAGAACEALVESTDLVATTLGAAGLDVPKAMTSRDLLPLMRGEVETVRDYAVTQHFNIRSIRTGTMKLVFYGGRDYGELYDLEADPYEMHNRWDDPDFAAQKAELVRMLMDWTVWSSDPKFRQVPEPTNKGSYGGFLKAWPDTEAHYLP